MPFEKNEHGVNHTSRLSTTLASAFLACGILFAAGQATAQEVTLRAASLWPKNFFVTESFLRFVDKVNAAGKGVVQINFVGGPEAVPASELPNAVRQGVVDVYIGSASYTLSFVPEADALAGGTKTPQELRANGGFALLDSIMQKKMNAKLLAMPDSGWSFVIYLKNEPKVSAEKIDLTGVKVRSLPLYNDFMSSLGAVNIVVPTTEMYTAFERSIVEGVPFPELGLRDFGIDRFVKYRVYPGYYQGDIISLVNADKWKGLSEQARNILNKVAIEHEAESRAKVQKDVAAEDAKLTELGVKKITLTGKAAQDYLEKANKVPWARMSKGDATNLEALKAKFQ